MRWIFWGCVFIWLAGLTASVVMLVHTERDIEPPTYYGSMQEAVAGVPALQIRSGCILARSHGSYLGNLDHQDHWRDHRQLCAPCRISACVRRTQGFRTQT